MDRENLYAIKTKNINMHVDEKNKFLHGKRNQIDGLYDIPIIKTALQHNNCILPSRHGLLYRTPTLFSSIKL